MFENADYETLVQPLLLKLAGLGVDVNARDEILGRTAAQYATSDERVEEQPYKLTHTLRACGSQESDFQNSWSSLCAHNVNDPGIGFFLKSLQEFPEYADGWSVPSD